MSLTLYYHPLSAFCWKALIALYEADAPFEGEIIDFGDPAAAARLTALWPMAHFPVLRDEARGLTLPESSIIIEHLAATTGKGASLLPADAGAALQARLWDRFFDGFIAQPMQKIVGDAMRPADGKDPLGVDKARATIRLAYGVLEDRFAAREEEAAGETWAAGEGFTIADCAAAPALFYAEKVGPFSGDHPYTARYFARLSARTSVARVLEEAEPYMHLFPG